MKTVKQIADDLNVSKTTIRRYLKQIEAAHGSDYLKSHTKEGKAGRLLLSDELAYNIIQMFQGEPEQTGTQPEQNETQPIHEPERTGAQPEQTETGQNTDSTNQLIELLKEQLQRKDEQIYLLNERVKDLTEALKASQTIQAMYIQKIEEHEQDQEQEPPERKNFFQKLFKL